MPRANYKRPGWRAPIELRAHRTGLLAFGVCALLLLLLGRAENSMVDQVRMAAADFASDLLQAGSAVTGGVERGIDTVANAVTLYDENDRLRAENQELLEWRSKAMEYERRIRSFESILDISYAPIAGVTTASVIADTGGPFARAIIVNAGKTRGVREGDAALDRFGLVGRVVGVGRSSARVLLLTDTTSRVPVVIEPNGTRAIVSGDADGLPRMEFVAPGVTLMEGAAIVTSGDGGVLPPGIPVGVVHLAADGTASAHLYADIARVEVVALKRYDFKNDVDEPDPTPMAGQPPIPETPEVAVAPAPGGR